MASELQPFNPRMFDTTHIGTELTPFAVDVDTDRLCSFAKATGQADPVYFDEAAAQAAGHRSIPVPPTFLFCLEMMDSPNPMEVYERLGIDYARVLHGEQHFVYHQLAYAGERLNFRPRITDVYKKKAGTLSFLVWETRVESENRHAVADLKSVMVVCNQLSRNQT